MFTRLSLLAIVLLTVASPMFAQGTNNGGGIVLTNAFSMAQIGRAHV